MSDFNHRQWAEDNLADVATDVENYVTSWKVSSAAELGFVKFNVINALGKYEDSGETVAKYYTAPFPKSGGSTSYPPQVAVVLTHHTDLTRGPGSKGRMFLPSPSVGISGVDGRMTAASALEIADAHATFLKNLNEWPGGDPTSGGECRVFSKIGAGSSNKIVRVSCGRAFDTVRTRRNAIVEDYVSSAISP